MNGATQFEAIGFHALIEITNSFGPWQLSATKGAGYPSNAVMHCGWAWVAYIPNGRVVGISKLARVVDVYAKRLQIQEHDDGAESPTPSTRMRLIDRCYDRGSKHG
jgi:hypothetical protein